MDDLLSEFLTETVESLAILDVELIKLEQNPNDPELLGNIFRLVHTIKGTCGFLGLPRLESVAHAGENVLGKVRDGDLEVTPDAVSLILDCLDRIRALTTALEKTEAEPAGDDSALIDRLNALSEGRLAVEVPAPAPAPAAARGSLYNRIGGIGVIDAVIEVFYRRVLADDGLRGFFSDVNMDVLQGCQRAFVGKVLGGPADGSENEMRNVQEGLFRPGMTGAQLDRMAGHLAAALTDLEVAPETAEAVLATLRAHTEAAVASGAPADKSRDAGKTATSKKLAAAAPGGRGDDTAKESMVANQSIRVNVDLLENLMTMVSELVLTRNQVLRILRTQKDSEFAAPLHRLNHITSELQDGVMKTRMQPVGYAWAKLPRLVRDLAHELDKKIELQMLGADTELDRQVLELIKDPLTHMVRNSADHGLETPAERRRAGKAEIGKITLNAYHKGGHIIIEITDDGRGLSIEKIKVKAVQNGLATEAELESMSVRQIQQFIFKAGFSTATKVTSVSGRGVGMDVLRTNMEKIGGTVELRSDEGKGSTFVMKIPLTLTIVSALIVGCGGERFAIPQISVVELVRASANSAHRVEWLKDTPVLRLRNRLLPLVSLREMLKLGDTAGSSEKDCFIVVTQVGNYRFGIMVDQVFDTEEIVVKPVSSILRDINLYSGNTILGDGSVIMILDPNAIAMASGQMTLTQSAGAEPAAPTEERDEKRVPLLLFRAGEEAPKAVPLALVARLEEVDVSTIEVSAGRMVVQYRGQLMPLVPLDSNHQMRERGRQPVLVFSDRDHSMGLVVDEIVDIVEERLSVGLFSDQQGRIGSAVVAGHATDLIDAGYYLTQAFSDWFKAEGDSKDGDIILKRLLLVDDSPFFRNLLSPLLSVAGYAVTAVESADRALALCEAGADFDVIVSDIEMPGMSGFEFVKTIKKNSRWQDTPIIALSSHASARDIDRGRVVGFDDYVAKFDREKLLQTLSETLADVRGAA